MIGAYKRNGQIVCVDSQGAEYVVPPADKLEEMIKSLQLDIGALNTKMESKESAINNSGPAKFYAKRKLRGEIDSLRRKQEILERRLKCHEWELRLYSEGLEELSDHDDCCSTAAGLLPIARG